MSLFKDDFIRSVESHRAMLSTADTQAHLALQRHCQILRRENADMDYLARKYQALFWISVFIGSATTLWGFLT